MSAASEFYIILGAIAAGIIVGMIDLARWALRKGAGHGE